MVIFGFAISFIIIIAIGVYAGLKKQKSSEDYYLASGSTKPWLIGLSTGVTNNSGWMLTGFVAYAYTSGFQALTLLLGFIAGDLMMSLFAYKALKEATDRSKQIGFGQIISSWYGQKWQIFPIIAGIITLVFLLVYASAQFLAADKAFIGSFDVPSGIGILMAAVVAGFYSIFGGMRATIWTDAAQAIILLVSLIVLDIYVISVAGGLDSFIQEIKSIGSQHTNYLSFFPNQNSIFSGALFLGGWIAGGIATLGQPHIMSRFMSMDSSKSISQVRIWSYTWQILILFSVFIIAIGARFLMPDIDNTEYVLPELTSALFPKFLIGVMLASVFAATMSTADSQILACSSAVSKDLISSNKISYRHTQLITFSLIALCCALAYLNLSSVFKLVLFAWGIMGVCFAPIVIIMACKGKPSELTACLMMAIGVIAMQTWSYYSLGDYAYAVLPGMVASFFVFFLSLLVGRKI